jgi:hypothetical protein
LKIPCIKVITRMTTVTIVVNIIIIIKKIII